MSARPDGSDRGPFWSVFEHSQIPMALVDRDRRYVALNDAAVRLYQCPREDLVGRRATSCRPGRDPALADATWERFVRTGELYGNEVIYSFGAPLRVSYAAHTTNLNGQWLAVFVVLSAQREPQGAELVGPVAPHAGAAESASGGTRFTPFSKALTPREREIVHRVALGRSTPQIAADLNLSPATVRSHVRNAMVKAGAHTRAQLVALVLGEGMARA